MEFKWEDKKLSEIGYIVTGKTPSTKIEKNFGDRVPFLTPSDDMDARYVYETKRYLSDEGVNEVRKKLIPKNSVCISCIGSQLGKVTITTEETVTNQQINSIVINDEYNIHFIYYLLLILGQKLNFLSKSSTAVPIINKKFFSEISVKVPQRQLQDKIAILLDSLDSKIEINNKIISNLESQTQAIFKSWFVDFEPFQDGNFVESELGMIPEGWEVKPIGELLDFDIGGGWGKEKPQEKYLIPAYVIRGTDIPNSKLGYFNMDNYRYHTESNLKNRRLQVGDIIFESSGGSTNQDLGRMLLVTDELLNEYNNDIICASFCKLIRINDSSIRWFVYNLLEYSYKNKILTKYEVKSTGISNFSFTIFKDDFKIAVPNRKTMERYFNVTGNNINLSAKLGVQNTKLAELRDALLPKLMAGEIDVSNIKIEGEEVKNE